MDIVGPLPPTPGGVRFVLLATNYFIKWVEASAYSSITSKEVTKFLKSNIITRFSLLRIIVSDNGKQFQNAYMEKLCQEQGIEHRFSSCSYPQENGQAEITNQTIFDNLKKKLESRKGLWLKELSNVLRAYRTSERRPTGNKPYSLVYDIKAILPMETTLPKLRSKLTQLAETMPPYYWTRIWLMKLDTQL
ncbi:uncharacterized protein LOC127900787 [Citrus sinensis]|uniref:uncharacterized protein LOC127900787 n=1 Tax=Citrus sinensis TaxID=2711 RepID=UPI002279915F|nr:uncharacterized protein LOC127900787 [Citrus sinensis]